MLTSALTKTHLSGSAVYLPSIVGGKILQSQTLTPLRTDPRLRDATDTVSNGAGGAAPRRMTLDGAFMIPKTLPLNRLTVGKHTQTVALQDTAGSVLKYTNTFVVTTSFADLATVIDQYADNALRTTLNGATGGRRDRPAAGEPRSASGPARRSCVDTGDNQETVTIAKALSPPPTVQHDAVGRRGRGRDRRSGWRATRPRRPAARTRRRSTARSSVQPIVLDTGANQEVISVARHIVPVPAAPAPNVVLSAPLAKDHAAGTATSLANVILSAPLTKAHATGVRGRRTRGRSSSGRGRRT